MEKTADQIYLEGKTAYYRSVAEDHLLEAELAETALKKGKKFVNVHNVNLKIGGVYFIRRVRKSTKNGGRFLGQPTLANWTEIGWYATKATNRTIESGYGGGDTLEVWS